MNTRLVIPILCAAAVVYACGPRSHSDRTSIASAAHVRQTSSSASGVTRRATADTVGAIQSKLEVDVADREVHFALNVTNVSPKHVELSFPNGRSYDFMVVDSVGREIWQWSAGRMFTQGMRNKQLGSKDSMRVDESWKVDAPAGHYTAIATLNSSNYPVEQRVDFFIP